MAKRAIHSRRAVLAALLAIPSVATADEPPPPRPASTGGRAPAPSGDVCDAAVAAWAARASRRGGVEITAVSCPGELVRFAVRGAGCDYEVRKGKGFQSTADGAHSVSPIANLEWSTAPASMKKGLDTLLAALTEDPTLPITGGAQRRPPRAAGAREDRLAVGAALLITAGALGLWWTRGPSRPSPPSES